MLSSLNNYNKETYFDKAYQLFFGDDIFISHSRIDGINYAKKLARLLQKKYRLRCFADFYWTETGEKLPPFLIRKLRRSTILVVIITEGAVKSPKNIREEIEIFKRTERPILVINVNGKYQKHEWIDLYGISDVKDFSDEKVLSSDKIRPSLTVLKSIKESFNYRTKYDQQKRSAFLAFALLILSFLIAVGTSVYSSNIISTARKDRLIAIEEKNQANNERETAINEKNRINEEFNSIQNRYDTIQITLKNNENDLNNTKLDLKNIAIDKERSEAATEQAKKEKQKAETDLEILNKKLEKANELTKEFERRQQEAQAKTLELQKKIGEAEASLREYKIKVKELEVRAKGSEASLLSTQPNRRFIALQRAKEAVDSNRELNPSYIFDEVQKGLTDAVNAMSFAKPLNTDNGFVTFTKISPSGHLIFGIINDSKNDKVKAVIWDAKKPDEYTLLKTESDSARYIKDIAFSRDEKRLLILYPGGIVENWEILKKQTPYKIEYRNNLKYDFPVNKADTLALSAENDLIVGYPDSSTKNFPHFRDPGERRGDDQYIFYNIAKNKEVMLRGYTVDRLEGVLESGDFLVKNLKEFDYGPYGSPFNVRGVEDASFAVVSLQSGGVYKIFPDREKPSSFQINSSGDRTAVSFVAIRLLFLL